MRHLEFSESAGNDPDAYPRGGSAPPLPGSTTMVGYPAFSKRYGCDPPVTAAVVEAAHKSLVFYTSCCGLRQLGPKRLRHLTPKVIRKRCFGQKSEGGGAFVETLLTVTGNLRL